MVYLKYISNRDLSLMVKYETFNLYDVGSNPTGLKLFTFKYIIVMCMLYFWAIAYWKSIRSVEYLT
jgi:hypothetical protein